MSQSSPAARGRRHSATLALLALGVVYGDIGTSPLYAIRECFYGPHAVALTHDHVLGVLSLIFWALIIVISIKYLMFVLRADNHGEGGILALTALATPIKPTGRSERSLADLRSACLARRCCMATASSRRRSRCWAPWRG